MASSPTSNCRAACRCSSTSRSIRSRRSSPTAAPTGRGARELDDLERVFKALAHASRRQVLVVLNARGGRMTAGEIAGRFSCTWPTTSRHLRVLEDAGLVRVDRRGREWIYVLEIARLERVVGRWLGWFEPTQQTKGKAP